MPEIIHLVSFLHSSLLFPSLPYHSHLIILSVNSFFFHLSSLPSSIQVIRVTHSMQRREFYSNSFHLLPILLIVNFSPASLSNSFFLPSFLLFNYIPILSHFFLLIISYPGLSLSPVSLNLFPATETFPSHPLLPLSHFSFSSFLLFLLPILSAHYRTFSCFSLTYTLFPSHPFYCKCSFPSSLPTSHPLCSSRSSHSEHVCVFVCFISSLTFPSSFYNLFSSFPHHHTFSSFYLSLILFHILSSHYHTFFLLPIPTHPSLFLFPFPSSAVIHSLLIITFFSLPSSTGYHSFSFPSSPPNHFSSFFLLPILSAHYHSPFLSLTLFSPPILSTGYHSFSFPSSHTFPSFLLFLLITLFSYPFLVHFSPSHHFPLIISSLSPSHPLCSLSHFLLFLSHLHSFPLPSFLLVITLSPSHPLLPLSHFSFSSFLLFLLPILSAHYRTFSCFSLIYLFFLPSSLLVILFSPHPSSPIPTITSHFPTHHFFSFLPFCSSSLSHYRSFPPILSTCFLFHFPSSLPFTLFLLHFFYSFPSSLLIIALSPVSLSSLFSPPILSILFLLPSSPPTITLFPSHHLFSFSFPSLLSPVSHYHLFISCFSLTYTLFPSHPFYCFSFSSSLIILYFTPSPSLISSFLPSHLLSSSFFSLTDPFYPLSPSHPSSPTITLSFTFSLLLLLYFFSSSSHPLFPPILTSSSHPFLLSQFFSHPHSLSSFLLLPSPLFSSAFPFLLIITLSPSHPTITLFLLLLSTFSSSHPLLPLFFSPPYYFPYPLSLFFQFFFFFSNFFSFYLTSSVLYSLLILHFPLPPFPLQHLLSFLLFHLFSFLFLLLLSAIYSQKHPNSLNPFYFYPLVLK
ncbi:unnamed protein product [Acanthosepion pharaonis]|uniref:Uncharacterized protein n=1 Tax=Acanthosepion pharaonis TaxID=158019 RepID=A0A812E6B2_ACAPH|nr:unnamed protein product [Sepia pharaonis]